MGAGREILDNSYLLHFWVCPGDPRHHKPRYMQENNELTVPSSMKTAVPHAATEAPNNHITRENPMLPDDLKMTLGVAKMLDGDESADNACKSLTRNE